MEMSAATADEDIENQIKKLEETNLEDGDTEKANAIKIQEHNMETLQALQKKQKAGKILSFLANIKVFKGEKVVPDVTFEPELPDGSAPRQVKPNRLHHVPPRIWYSRKHS
jgi:hypothetical protein